MTSYKKKLAATVVALMLVFAPVRESKAIVPIIAAWLLELTGGSILIGDLVAGQAGIISAILWWDCNKFALNAPCTSKTPIPSTAQPKPAITVSLKPDTKRENPDPKKFNDPAAGKRDVTPKQTIAASGKGPPPTAQGIPGVPIGPGDIGVLTQSPRTTNVGAAGVDPAVQIAQYNGSVSHGGVVTGIEVAPQKAPAQPKAIPFIALATVCSSAPGPGPDCSMQVRASEQILKQYNGGKLINTAVIDCCTGAYFKYVSVAYLYDQASEVTLACDAGYEGSGKDAGGSYQCSLTDATKVKKPTDTTCEILFDPATKSFDIDNANTSCDGLTDTTKLSISAADGSQSVEVGVNAGNGFDINITKSDGSKTGLDTGVYDPGTGGYVIVHVNITPPPKPDNGLGCGGPGQGMCAVTESGDNATWTKSNDMQGANRAADTGMKGKMDGINSSMFNWSFIPAIPTASCKNPSLKSPIGNMTVDMDICVWFDRLSFFINAVLAVMCVYGCVHQVQSAIRD